MGRSSVRHIYRCFLFPITNATLDIQSHFWNLIHILANIYGVKDYSKVVLLMLYSFLTSLDSELPFLLIIATEDNFLSWTLAILSPIGYCTYRMFWHKLCFPTPFACYMSFTKFLLLSIQNSNSLIFLMQVFYVF